MTTDTPIHVHDCDRCVFLGCHDGQDLYFCPSQMGSTDRWTLISRYGIDGDYCSGGWKMKNPHMVEAHRRAVERGFLKPDQYNYN